MARYTGADCKRCRREKTKLFLKGAKCDSPKCPIEIRPYPPGEHGRNRPKESEYLRRTIPNWEEPHVHMDLVTFDTTVKAGNTTLIDNGFLMSLRDEQVVEAASRYGDPVELLEAYAT